MIDKVYCMSSYLALRYIERDDMDFYPDFCHKNGLIPTMDDSEIIYVKDSSDIDSAIGKQIEKFRLAKKGLMLSGGMDSAIVASYLSGSDAYTFRFLGGSIYEEEVKRAAYYAEKYGLKLHYVDIDWRVVEKNLDVLMKAKGAPVHSIEPQILEAAIQAKSDGIEIMFIAESSDLNFGGMDGLLSRDWTVEEFKKRYTFTPPEMVLKDYSPMDYIFEKYRVKADDMDFLKFIENVYSIESSSSYFNAFSVAGMSYCDPYQKLRMSDPLDLSRIRKGESKYLIRELMKKKYPEITVPEKIPMPRPVDSYFADWAGPKRHEFKNGIDMGKFSGNQKWQLYCLERFLNLYD